MTCPGSHSCQARCSQDINWDSLILSHPGRSGQFQKEFGNKQDEEAGGSSSQPCPDGRLSRYSVLSAVFPGKCCVLGCTLTSPFPRRSRPEASWVFGPVLAAPLPSPPSSDLREPQARSFQISPSEFTNLGFTAPTPPSLGRAKLLG